MYTELKAERAGSESGERAWENPEWDKGAGEEDEEDDGESAAYIL